MTTELSTPPARSSTVSRYGPLAVIVVAILVVAVLASTGGGSSSATKVAARAAATTTVPSTHDPDLPVLYSQAKAAGTLAKYDFGSRCDPKTGRLKIPSVFSPPCVPVFTGSNGGATYQGVTATAVKVVVYVAGGNSLVAALQGLSDPPAKQEQQRLDDVDMLQHLYETYGRKIQLVEFKTNSDPADAEAAEADAIKVAQEIKPFASIGGPAETPAYADELALHKILCISCGVSLPDATYQKNAPYMWGVTQTPEQFLVSLSAFIGTQLLHKPAVYAGDPAMRKRTRVFGVVHFEEDPPVFNGIDAATTKAQQETGYKAAVTLTYTLDVPKLAERAATIIAKLKQAKVTSVIFLGDPLMPIYLTKEATAQHYFPEWIVTGTVLTDTTVFGRQYDPKQWAHAFGISTLPARLPQKQA